MQDLTKEYQDNLKILTAMESIKERELTIMDKYGKLMEQELAPLQEEKSKIQKICQHSFKIKSIDYGNTYFKQCVKCELMEDEKFRY